MSDHAINLEPIVDKYKANDNTAGLLLFGSAFFGRNDKYSDIDIYVIGFKPAKISREQFKIGDQTFDVLFDCIDEVKKLISEEKNQIRRNVSLMVGNSKVIFQKSDEMEGLIRSAKECLATETTYSDEQRLMHRYSIEDFLSDAQRDFESMNWTGFWLNAGFVLQNCIEVVLKAAGDYFRKPSDTITQLNRLDPEFCALLKSFFELSDKSERANVLQELAARGLAKAGGPLPPNWKI
ncbi:MAG TPA: hypothetical protein VG964_00030 [Candidatus Saccharimonadales bacterium]|nr:hypothetical protein [Candidatus Saccharimonadales bacterium]